MALFDTRPRRVLKSIQKLAAENMVDQAAVKVEQEYRSMIESKEVARELVAFLMDIGYPDLAARVSEDIIRTHKDLRDPVLKHLEDRQGEFPRSFELLRTLWQEKVKGLDFSGAITLLNRVDRTTEAKLFEALETTARSADKYAMGDKLLTGDIDKFLGWSLALHRKGKNREALEALAKASEKVDERDSRIPQLIDWISTRRGGRDPEATLFLIKSYLGMDNLEAALTAVPVLYDAPREIVTEAISMVEKDIIPRDLSHRSRIYLARLHAAVDRFDDACRALEQLIEEDHIDEEVAQTVQALVREAPGKARPLLVQARFKKAAGEVSTAIDSIEQAFAADDVTESPVADVCREFLDEGVDRDSTVARGLASFLTENGSIAEAVEALGGIVATESDWVVSQLQKLLVRRKDSAEALTLLAIAMQLQGREADAERTLKHLQERQDRRSQEDMLLVLDKFDSLMGERTGLRKIRATVRWTAGHKLESAEDWLMLLLAGEQVPGEAVSEMIRNGLHRKQASAIVESGFQPTSP
ncbi:hypothetical protein JW921_03615, partial [Candidatus Fermentibacterales bacterium]|nr:hypothetical protein [Candidatus Fermentibacterales bacterium]